ncbi:P2X purinoceptor 7-like [Lingula anatina]|uniref:P2X purinoceptor 7-like n=1 Tax=Lingula anatina TaxID=7574 RepID=A0A1S3I398_LINAN|nr:P2X purinoceptor 7-like [Lingula anatina]|eukprot:XP_013391824.1 P2X purinoceptor 7-like [Lingula anatina]
MAESEILPGFRSSSTSSSAESTEEAVRPSTGRWRRGRSRGGRERGGRGRRGRGVSRLSSRSRSSQRSSRDQVAEVAAENLLKRQETMRNAISKMDVAQLRDICLSMAEKHPSLVFDLLQPPVPQPGGYHPQPDVASPSWCVCQKCREMPTDIEKQCCGKENCITLLPVSEISAKYFIQNKHYFKAYLTSFFSLQDFSVLNLDEGVLNLARLYRRDVLALDDEENNTKANRYQAYRQFTLWVHGHLGAGNRRVIPSCSVWAIRDKFPDAYGHYRGFIPNRIG